MQFHLRNRSESFLDADQKGRIVTITTMCYLFQCFFSSFDSLFSHFLSLSVALTKEFVSASLSSMAASSASPAGPSKSDFPRRQAGRLTSWSEGPVPWPGTGGRREEGAQDVGLPGFLPISEEEILGMGQSLN